MAHPFLCLSGNSLDAAQVTALARSRLTITVDTKARERVREAHGIAQRIVGNRRVYGYTTGVGANRTTCVAKAPAHDAFGMQLLRSHSGGIGPEVPGEQVRAMLAVRLNQLLAGGTSIQVEVLDRIAEALASGHLPTVHAFGAIGTGDLSALGELGLTLAGELPWQGGNGPAPASIVLDRRDALPLMSSGALTIGQSALGATDLKALLDQVPLIAALTLTAIRGSAEAYSQRVHDLKPHAGTQTVAARMRQLLSSADWTSHLVQDPFGLRCLPQVDGAAVDAWRRLDEVLAVEINAAAENPLLDADEEDYHHHGGFHQAQLALALDQFRLSLVGTAALSAARLGYLVEPSFTGLSPFLSDGSPGSSGVMITEYTAQSALAELRTHAQPVSLGHAVISRGSEDHASFASTGARRLLDSVQPFQLVLACELLAAIRALRLRDFVPPGCGELRDFYETAVKRLQSSARDRNLTEDLHTAAAILADGATS